MTLIERILQNIRSAFLANRVVLKKSTSFDRLQSLVNKIKPMNIDKMLIRIGGDKGGGYLIPKDFNEIVMCFSPGVGDTANFESQLLNDFQIPSCLADYSVDKVPNNFKPFSFTKKYIGAVNNEKYMTLDEWITKEIGQKDGDLILQMDIEGSEYLSLLSVPEQTLEKFRIIVIEIHGVSNWGDPAYFELVEVFFERLTKYFVVVHNHPTNASPILRIGKFSAPSTFELTLIRKDRVNSFGPVTSLPHILDKPCVPEKDEIKLPENWYGN